MLDAFHSHLDGSKSTEDFPSLSSCLEAVNDADISNAMSLLSAFSDSVNSLQNVQRSNLARLEDQERLDNDVRSPLSATESKESGDTEHFYEQNDDGTGIWPYRYYPLEEGHIRILELLPGARTDPISCRLIETPMADARDFEAISYTWGTEEPICTIQINGGSFLLRPNLEAALVELRAGIDETGAISEPDSSEEFNDFQSNGSESNDRSENMSQKWRKFSPMDQKTMTNLKKCLRNHYHTLTRSNRDLLQEEEAVVVCGLMRFASTRATLMSAITKSSQ